MPSGRGGRYRQIADDLLAEIRSGDYGPGTLLPSTSELVARYGVSKNTVVAAMEVLRASGMVVTRQGAPAYVREFRKKQRTSPARLTRERWGSGRAIQGSDSGGEPRVVDVVPAREPNGASL